MENTVINTLKYTGIVTLSQYTGSKKVKITQLHNAGGGSLFKFFANCLVGDFTAAKLLRPTKIMLVEPKNKNSLTEGFQMSSQSGGFIYQLTKPEIVPTKDTSRVRYSFIIPKDIVSSITDTENLYLCLYTDEVPVYKPDDYAAICKLDIAKNNIANAALVIDWELVISNADAN